MTNMTFEELLKTKIKIDDIEIQPDFRVVVQAETDQGVHVIIHPLNYSGNTLDFLVNGNELKEY